MKKLGMIFASLLFVGLVNAQDSSGLEGDNLDLNGVLELFKESEDVEDFEKKLNSEDNGVNNLDLNEDGQVDYIRVVDYAEDDAHALALQVPVNETESQDVAVIEMEQVDEKTTNLQVIGDAELYGESYMIEPQDERNKNIVVNVNTWRPVRHMYGPRYTVWVSPWGWNARPVWYQPWRRLAWNAYYPRVYQYRRPCYRMANVRRCQRVNVFYAPRRMHSQTFYANHHHHHIGGKSAVGQKSTNTAGMKSNPSTGKTVGTKSTARTSSPTQNRTSTTRTTTSQQKSGSQVSRNSTGTTRNTSTQTQRSSSQRQPSSVKSSSTRKSSTSRSSSSSRGKSSSGRSSGKSGGKSSGGRR